MSEPEKKEEKKEEEKGEKKEEEKGEKKEEEKGEKKEEEKGDKEKEGEEKGEKKEGAEGKGKDCKTDQHYCAGEKVAAILQEPSKLGEELANVATGLVDKGVKKVIGAITDQTKCVQLFTSDLPNLVQNIIKGIGNNTSDAINKITDSVKNLFSELGDREIKGYPNLFGPFETVYAIIIIKIQGIIDRIALGENANQILADPSMDPKKLFAKMMKTSERYSDAVKEAEFQGAFKEWISNYVSALLKTLDIAQPEIDRINKKLKDIIQGMGDNVGKSISHALLNIVKAIVFNIPVVGGIVSVLLSADELGQEIINTCKPPIAKGAGIIMPVVNGVNKQIDKTKCAVDKLGRILGPILSVKKGGGTSKNSTGNGNGTGTGTGTGNDKYTRKKIKNATKRLRYMFSRFGTRRHRHRHRRRQNNY